MYIAINVKKKPQEPFIVGGKEAVQNGGNSAQTNVVKNLKRKSMEVNTLVKHKKLKTLGIGCIAKISGKKVKVNFGTDDVATCSPSQLVEVDTSKCKTMTFDKFRSLLVAPDKMDKEDKLIIGNELKEWVGFGFVSLRVVTEDDLKRYKRVV